MHEPQMSLGEVITAGRAPLADRMRPRELSEVIGQPQLTGPRTLLSRALADGRPYSLVLYGPPGTGKTTIALAIARQLGFAFEQLNAVADGIGEFRKVLERAKERRGRGEQTLLFIDELHRWSKSQQDAALPAVEAGMVTLIGATTENPAFALNRALRSRLRVERVVALDDAHMGSLARRALTDSANGLGGHGLSIDEDALNLLVLHAGGDGRALLGGLEAAALLGRWRPADHACDGSSSAGQSHDERRPHRARPPDVSADQEHQRVRSRRVAVLAGAPGSRR